MAQNGRVRPATREDVPIILSMMKAAAFKTRFLEKKSPADRPVTATEADLLNTLDFPPELSPSTNSTASSSITSTDPISTPDSSVTSSDGTATATNPHTETPTPTRGKAIVVETPEGEVVGMAIYYTTYISRSAMNGIWIEELYVTPGREFKFRGVHYANLLMYELIMEAESLSVGTSSYRLDGAGPRLSWHHGSESSNITVDGWALGYFHNVLARQVDGGPLFAISGSDLIYAKSRMEEMIWLTQSNG